MTARIPPGTILVVEDDRNINEVVTEYMKDAGYTVISHSDGEQARSEILSNADISLFILDILLPGASGMELLNEIRNSAAHRTKPVVMLTALGDEATQILSFDALADDFVAKPFSPRVLVRRVNALLRRGAGVTKVLRFEGVEIDFDRYEVYDNGAQVNLTVREIELLAALMRNTGMVFTRQRLLDLVWGHDYFGDERIVDAHIKNLRKKLTSGVIQTVKGIGYKLGNE